VFFNVNKRLDIFSTSSCFIRALFFIKSLDYIGQIIVDKTKIYQQEKGQWADPEAFLKV